MGASSGVLVVEECQMCRDVDKVVQLTEEIHKYANNLVLKS